MKDISRIQTAKKIMKMILDLCNIAGYGLHSGIRPGKSGDAAAQYILDKLHYAGLQNAKREPIKVNNPYPKEYGVVVETRDKKISLSDKCFPLQYCMETAPEGVSGEMVYVGNGYLSDFNNTDLDGKIALIDEKMIRGYIASAREATVKAKDEGAIAVLRANMQVDCPQQQKGEGVPENLFPIPVFCVSKSGGDYLRDLVLSGTSHIIRMTLKVSREKHSASNIVIELPGNGGSDEVILVGTHYDTGHFTGAVDNNGSVALMIKLAKYFALKPRELRNRDMIFAWCFGHDFDLNSGHYQFAEAHKEQLIKAIVWDIDHAVGGIRFKYDKSQGKIVPVEDKTCEFYIISNNYTYSRFAAFSMDKYGFTCTQNRFESTGQGPQWGIAPTTSPWVNVASIPIYYHSTLDTPDKITLDQIIRAYNAHIEIIEHIDQTPNGFLFYDNISKTRQNKAPEVSIALLSDTIRVGDTLRVWNDETRFYDDKTSYHYPALPEWAGTYWDWGDGTPVTFGGPTAEHTYQNPGYFKITLNFTDTEGATSTAVKDITVLPMQ